MFQLDFPFPFPLRLPHSLTSLTTHHSFSSTVRYHDHYLHHYLYCTTTTTTTTTCCTNLTSSLPGTLPTRLPSLPGYPPYQATLPTRLPYRFLCHPHVRSFTTHDALLSPLSIPQAGSDPLLPPLRPLLAPPFHFHSLYTTATYLPRETTTGILRCISIYLVSGNVHHDPRRLRDNPLLPIGMIPIPSHQNLVIIITVHETFALPSTRRPPCPRKTTTTCADLTTTHTSSWL